MRLELPKSVISHIITLIAIPMALSGTGYALFSQQLSVEGTTSKPAYSRSQNLSVSYTRSVTPTVLLTSYEITVTITNNGTKGVTAWKSDFSLPSDATAVSCSNAGCTQSGSVNTAVNTTNNGTIEAGGTVNYVLSFTSGAQNYLFTSIVISGTPAIVYQNVSGLSVAVTGNSSTKQGANYVYPRGYNVTNTSNTRVLNWRIIIPWNNADSVSSMDTSVDYVISTNELTIFSKQALEPGSSFNFNAQYSSRDRLRTFNSATIEGDI